MIVPQQGFYHGFQITAFTKWSYIIILQKDFLKEEPDNVVILYLYTCT